MLPMATAWALKLHKLPVAIIISLVGELKAELGSRRQTCCRLMHHHPPVSQPGWRGEIIGCRYFRSPMGERNEAIENIIKGQLENQHMGPLCARVNASLRSLFCPVNSRLAQKAHPWRTIRDVVSLVKANPRQILFDIYV